LRLEKPRRPTIAKQPLRWTIATVILLFAGTARAQHPDFGDTGHVAISAERLFGFVHTSITTSTAGGGSTSQSTDTLTLLTNPLGASTTGYSWPRIALDVFLSRGISLGGSLGYFNVSPTTGSISGFLFAPRVGYAGHLSPRLAIWPRGGITFEQVSTSSGGVGSTTTKQSVFALTLEAPLTILVAPRIHVLVGPTLDLGLTGSRSTGNTSFDRKVTDFGIQVGLLVLL
jgi:hypothetical protein